jgi:hypothetical protein
MHCACSKQRGTGQLAGLTGKMSISIADGERSYDFEYIQPEAA